MGTIAFFVPNRDQLCAHSVKTCHLVGFDGIPWQAVARLDGDLLTIVSEDHESARLVIPWQVEGVGPVAISTSTLVQRIDPYLLPVELARGSLCRLRNQISDWSLAGLEIPDSIRQILAEGEQNFARAAIQQHDAKTASQLSNRAITLAFQAGLELTRVYSSIRTKEQTVWNGCSLDGKIEEIDHPDLAAILIPCSWNKIEANQDEFNWGSLDQMVASCANRRLRSFVGPLVDLSHDAMPDWLLLWQNDFESVESFVRRFLCQLSARFRGKVHLWNCFASINTETDLGLTEEQRLRLTVAMIESIREHDNSTPLLVTIDQPWGEYHVNQTLDLTPMQFADMLSRADIGITGFGLRLNFGTSLSDTLLRDPLEISRLLDTWSLFGKPIVLFVNVESEFDRQFLRQMLPLLRAKQSVQGIIWGSQSRDVWTTDATE